MHETTHTSPLGPIRLYARTGFNYHRGESGTTQVIDPVTITNEDGTTTTTPGSTDSVDAKTDGWSMGNVHLDRNVDVRFGITRTIG